MLLKEWPSTPTPEITSPFWRSQFAGPQADQVAGWGWTWAGGGKHPHPGGGAWRPLVGSDPDSAQHGSLGVQQVVEGADPWPTGPGGQAPERGAAPARRVQALGRGPGP